jgi:PRTRC genetic system protein C
MSSLKKELLLREFQYNGVRIPDPGPELTVIRSANFSYLLTLRSRRHR